MALFKISRGKTADKLAAQAMEEGHCWFTTEDQRFYIDYEIDDPNNTGKKIVTRNYIGYTDLADKASISQANTYNGEQKFQNKQYCATAQDNASGVGCAYKASRGAVNQEIIGEIIMPYTAISDSTFNMNNEVDKIKFEKITDTSDGQPTLSTVATMTPDQLTMNGHILSSVDGNPWFGLYDGTNHWRFQAVKDQEKVGLGPTWTEATTWDVKGNMVVPGTITSNGKIAAESSTTFAVWNSNTLCSQSVTAYTDTEIQTMWDNIS